MIDQVQSSVNHCYNGRLSLEYYYPTLEGKGENDLLEERIVLISLTFIDFISLTL